MRPQDLAQWIETAKTKDAVKVAVYRAKSNHGKEALLDELPIKGVDSDALLARMRDDLLESRRMHRGVYELHALDKEVRIIMRERITLSRDEDEEGVPDDPKVAATRIYLTETRAAFTEMRSTVRDARDMMVSANDCLRQALQDVTKQNTEFQTKMGEMLSSLYEIAQMKVEREEAARAAAERRAMAGKALEEGMPILGSIIAKASKKTGPALVSFFRSLSEDQKTAIMSTLRPEQAGTLSTVLGMVEAEQKGGADA